MEQFLPEQTDVPEAEGEGHTFSKEIKKKKNNIIKIVHQVQPEVQGALPPADGREVSASIISPHPAGGPGVSEAE